jgi:hypothetical protein
VFYMSTHTNTKGANTMSTEAKILARFAANLSKDVTASEAVRLTCNEYRDEARTLWGEDVAVHVWNTVARTLVTADWTGIYAAAQAVKA